jgi:hypothetical protein
VHSVCVCSLCVCKLSVCVCSLYVYVCTVRVRSRASNLCIVCAFVDFLCVESLCEHVRSAFV